MRIAVDCTDAEVFLAFLDLLGRNIWNARICARGTMDAIFAGADFSATGGNGNASEFFAALVGNRSREDDGGCGDGDVLVMG